MCHTCLTLYTLYLWGFVTQSSRFPFSLAVYQLICEDKISYYPGPPSGNALHADNIRTCTRKLMSQTLVQINKNFERKN